MAIEHKHIWRPYKAFEYSEDFDPVYQSVIVSCKCGKVETFTREFKYTHDWRLLIPIGFLIAALIISIYLGIK